MKKLLLSAILFASCFLSLAQSQNNYTYSVGVKLLSIGEFPKLLNEVRGTNNFRSSVFNGLIFKVNDNQISYRVVLTKYENDDYSFKNLCNNCETVTGEYADFTMKLGFEKSLIYGIIQPMYGVDLGFKKVTFDGDAYPESSTTPSYNAIVEKNGGFIYPFLGLKANVLKARITVSAEAGINMLYTYDKETKTSYADNSTTLNNFRRWGFYTRPLGLLSLQYNFTSQ